jgi:hypothetical protein
MYLSDFYRFLLCTCGWERSGERRVERRGERRGERMVERGERRVERRGERGAWSRGGGLVGEVVCITVLLPPTLPRD